MWTCEHVNICEHVQNVIKMWTHISYILCQMPEPDARCQTEGNVTADICVHIFKIVFFRSFCNIQEAALWPRAIPMDPFEIRVEGYTRYGRPRRSLFSLKSPYLWDSTPDICVHILSRNVSADRNVTAYICIHISKKTDQMPDARCQMPDARCQMPDARRQRNASADRNFDSR